MLETGDARFLKGQYVYKKVIIDEKEKENQREGLLRNRERRSAGVNTGDRSVRGSL